MNVHVEDLSSVKKKIKFTIPAERVDSEIEKAYAEIQKRASVKGFRKGKVPRAFLEKHYVDQMAESVLKSLVNDTYFKALYEQKIVPVSHPEVESDDVVKGEPFSYSATVEIMPEVKVCDYKGLKVKKELFSDDDSAVNARLKEMQEAHAQLKPAADDHAAVNGDYVTISFIGYLDGVPFENGAGEDYPLELGSGRFIPGFEEQLVGAKSGEKREINLTFPADYSSKELAGKDVMFAVTVSDIKCKEMPELDDDFAAQFGEFKTVAELRAKIAEVHEQQERERIESDLKDRVVKSLVEKNNPEIPETLVQNQLDSMLENTKNRLAGQRMTLEMMGMDDGKFKEQYRDVAVLQVKGMVLLDAIARLEGFVVEDADIERRIEEIAAGARQDAEAVKKYYQQKQARENLVMQIREDKAMALVLEHAHVSEVNRSEI
jgi:trigger factor